MSDHAIEYGNLRAALARLQRELGRISTALRDPRDAAKREEEAAALQVLQGEVERLARSLTQRTAESGPQDQMANAQRLRRELAALPVCNPDDGFSSRDHDAELYRDPR